MTRFSRANIGMSMVWMLLLLLDSCVPIQGLMKATKTRSIARFHPTFFQYTAMNRDFIARDDIRSIPTWLGIPTTKRQSRLFSLTPKPDEEFQDDESLDQVDTFHAQDDNGVDYAEFRNGLFNEDDEDDEGDEVLYGKFQMASGRVTTGMYEALENDWKTPGYSLGPEFILRDEDDDENDADNEDDDGVTRNKVDGDNIKTSDEEEDDDENDDDTVAMDWNEKETFPEESSLLLQDDEEDTTSTINGEWKSTINPSNFFLETYQEIEHDDGISMPTSSGDIGYFQQRMDSMQQQLDQITTLVQNGFGAVSTSSTLPAQQNEVVSTPPTKFIPQHPQIVVPPVKAMLFIDGTWLYYSIHERGEHGCPILQKYGRGWQNNYQVDWAALPRLISQQLEKRRLRPIDMVRVLVFTSFKATTPKNSYRFQMYQEMQRHANYDVHMMETVGKSEKCVDISLAVEMLHYATVANAFDLAILLSGDKDFMPAMIRTRQKGRQMALASMRTGCNRELTSNPHVKDFPTVWIDQFLDQWIVPKDGAAVNGLPPSLRQSRSPPLSRAGAGAAFRSPAFADVPSIHAAAVKRLILDFVISSKRSRVASRDIGRYLKMLVLPTKTPVVDRKPFTMLDSVKKHCGSLSQFFSQMMVDDDIFFIEEGEGDEDKLMFWVGLKMEPQIAQTLIMKEFEEHTGSASDIELAFFEKYSLDVLEANAAVVYFHTYQADLGDRKPRTPAVVAGESTNGDITPQIQLPEELTRDYTLCTLMELKERCRERELPVSGTKAVLLERIRQDVEKGIARLEEAYTATANSNHRSSASRPSTAINAQRASVTPASSPSPSSSERYLAGLIAEYLQARGGNASSRDVGRYLAANTASPEMLKLGGPEVSALQELKVTYGSLRSFIQLQGHLFVRGEDTQSPTSGDFSFRIALRENANQLP